MQPFREKLAVTEILGRNSLQEDYGKIWNIPGAEKSHVQRGQQLIK